MQSRTVTKYFVIILSLTFATLFSDRIYAQKKTEKDFKKKLYISTIKAKSVNALLADRVKNGIRLGIFENFGAQYQVLDDDAIKVMYKQAEMIMASGCTNESCMTQIADGINADEIVYGDVSTDGGKISININCLERKNMAIGTKSIIKLSFFESQLDYVTSETAKKIINPQYKIDLSKAPDTSSEIKLGAIEIQTIKGLDISVIQFKSTDESAGKIIDFSKDLVAEGDEYFNNQKYSKARAKYLEIIEKVSTKLSSDKQAKIKDYVGGINKRIDSTYAMEFKPDIEKIDSLFKGIKEPTESDFEDGMKKYTSLEKDMARNSNQYYDSSNNQMLSVLSDRKDSIHLAIAAGFEKKANTYYRDYKFTEALDWYKKAADRAGMVKNDETKGTASERIEQKIVAAMKTGQGYLVNRVKSLVDQAEFYNYRNKTSDAKDLMREARQLITDRMRVFAITQAVEPFNNYANVLKMDSITEKSEPEVYNVIKKERAEVLLQGFKKKGLIKEIGGIKFVKIPAESFLMGSPDGEGKGDEHPRHRVTVDSFYLGMYEVTQKQYRDIMGENPSYRKGDDLPVEMVSYDDAMEFCKKFSEKYRVKARLLYEAEWEYACRAGSTTIYYWGDTINGDYCWYSGNSGDKIHPVGQKLPNAWGLYDMSGNVWEWCMDWYGGDYYKNSPERNPQGPRSGGYRVLRGGSWGSIVDADLRSASRTWYDPDIRCGFNGFRVALSIP